MHATRCRRATDVVLGCALILVLGLSSGLGCGSDEETQRVCEPGVQRECTCSNGESGSQRCYSDGSGWGECECSSSGNGGMENGDTDAGGGNDDRADHREVLGTTCENWEAGDLYCAENFEKWPEDGGERKNEYAYFKDGRVMKCNQSGKWEEFFSCPSGQNCAPIKGKRSFECGGTDPDARITYAKKGTSCANEQSGACSLDQSKLLECQRGTWIVLRDCGSGDARCDLVHSSDPNVECKRGVDTCFGCK